MLTFGMRTWCLIGALFVSLGYLGSSGLGRLLPSEDADTRTEIARQWARKVSVALPALPNRPRVAVARVVSDADGILTRELRDWIGRQNVRMVHDDWWQEPGYVFGITSEPHSAKEASDRIRHSNVDYIVCATIDEWVTYPEHAARLVGSIEIINVVNNSVIYSGRLGLPHEDTPRGSTESETSSRISTAVLDYPPDSSNVEKTAKRSESDAGSSQHTALSRSSPPSLFQADGNSTASLATMSVPSPLNLNVWQGLGVWLLTVILLPIALATPIQRVLRRRSNRDNGLMVLSWACLVLLAAWMFWGWSLSVFPLLLAFTVISGLAVIWFGFICSRLT